MTTLTSAQPPLVLPQPGPIALRASAPPVFVPEQPRHRAAAERTLDAAFGPGRFAKSSERVREFAAFAPELSRVAMEGEAVAGVCRIWRIGLGEAPALFLGPLGVAPWAQSQGLGAALVRAVLAGIDLAEPKAVILVGQPSFFEPLGFSRVPEGRVLMPAPTEPRRLMWRAPAATLLVGLQGPVTAPRDANSR